MAIEKYDIVIVGAGPAGSLAAYHAAKAGAKTLMLERDAVIGTPVRCGEAVTRVQVERHFPMEENYVAWHVDGAALHAPDGSCVEVESGDDGVVLERSIFDRRLAEYAALAGADIMTRADVVGLIKADDGRITGVTYTRYNEKRSVAADVVIGADGVESRVGRWAGLRTNMGVNDLESAYQIYIAGLKYDHRWVHFYFGNDIAPGGYVWVFPKSESVASVGIGLVAADYPPGESYRKLTTFIERLFGKAVHVGEMAGGVPTAKPIKTPITDGLILAGDAARHCNPLTGGGISSAMVAGEFAGKVAADCVTKGDVSKKALKAYMTAIDKEIVKPYNRAYRIAEGVYSLTDEQMNKTAHTILSLPPEKRTLQTVFMKGLMTQPKLLVDVAKTFL